MRECTWVNMWKCGKPAVRYMFFRGKPEAWCKFHSSKASLEQVMYHDDREISEQEYDVLSVHNC